MVPNGMGYGQVKLTRNVTLGKWRGPCEKEGVYGEAATPLGKVTLIRSPASRTDILALAERRERWKLILSGVVMELRNFGAPGHMSQKLLKRGVSGQFDETGFDIEASSAWRYSRRHLSFSGLDVTFVPRIMGVELREGGRQVALRGIGGDWGMCNASEKAVLSACLFEWADMGFFLRTPFVRLL